MLKKTETYSMTAGHKSLPSIPQDSSIKSQERQTRLLSFLMSCTSLALLLFVSFAESEKPSLCISYFQALNRPLVTVGCKEEQLTLVDFHNPEKAEEVVCVLIVCYRSRN